MKIMYLTHKYIYLILNCCFIKKLDMLFFLRETYYFLLDPDLDMKSSDSDPVTTKIAIKDLFLRNRLNKNFCMFLVRSEI